MEAGVNLYMKSMDEGLKLPTKDDMELNKHHFTCLQSAVKLFLEKAVMDEQNMFQRKMNVIIS